MTRLSLLAIALLFLLGPGPAQAQYNHYYLTDRDGHYHRYYSGDGYNHYYADRSPRRYYYSDYDYNRRVRAHKRRRNTLLGVGVVGAITGSGVLTGVGFGGAIANEVVDHRHRDW